jgi:hypothetical protein
VLALRRNRCPRTSAADRRCGTTHSPHGQDVNRQQLPTSEFAFASFSCCGSSACTRDCAAGATEMSAGPFNPPAHACGHVVMLAQRRSAAPGARRRLRASGTRTDGDHDSVGCRRGALQRCGRRNEQGGAAGGPQRNLNRIPDASADWHRYDGRRSHSRSWLQILYTTYTWIHHDCGFHVTGCAFMSFKCA